MSELNSGFEFEIVSDLVLLRFNGYWDYSESKKWKSSVQKVLEDFNNQQPFIFADLRGFKMGDIESFKLVKETSLYAFRKLDFQFIVMLADVGKRKVMEAFVQSVSLQYLDTKIFTFESEDDVCHWMNQRGYTNINLVKSFINK